jgi:electron transfer flavoprotein beta subunit
MMNIIVCVKEIMDPELAPDSFRIDPERKIGLGPSGAPTVLSPFDAQAVEAALQIKDALGAKVTVLSLGNNLHREVVKKPLAMGADELILLEDDVFEDCDSISTAKALVAAINKIGEYDLIVCGRQAADWDQGQVGLGIAQALNIPSVTLAKKIEIVENQAKIERVITDGYEVVEVSLPALITVSNELGEARYATTQGILASIRRQPVVWTLADLGMDRAQTERRAKLLLLFQPVREGECEIIEGETLEDAAKFLARRLRDEKIL